MACDGEGRNQENRRKKCEVCKGKGHWNSQDIDNYHKKYPHVCKSSCGEEHFSPVFTDRGTVLDDEFVARARELYHEDGHIEIDPDAEVSYTPDVGGAYVQAWIWIPDRGKKE